MAEESGSTYVRSPPLNEMVLRMIPPPSDVGVEDAIINCVLWLKLAVEATGAIVIGIGMLAAASQFTRTLFVQIRDYNRIRLTLARFLALALEFQLGADILSTAVAPSWDQIGKLGAIVVIRTALNYFLTREMQQEHEGIDGVAPGRGNGGVPAQETPT